MVWETENPDRWIPQGYVLVRADTRGTGRSPGVMHPLARKEQEDCFDVVEWAAAQPWSNGRVGMSGISWFGMLSWLVAAMRPPHLAAVVPWDGLSDFYREWAYQGGMLHNAFTALWWSWFLAPNQHGIGELGEAELAANRLYLLDEMREHPFDDAWHAERSPVVENIEIPVLSATSWGSIHLHLRGNVEGYLRAGSAHKRLLIFPGDHISPFYEDWAVAERMRFFDRWLKGRENGSEHDPPVRLCLRRGEERVWRDEQDWPLSSTDWTTWHLDATTSRVGRLPPETPGTMQYEAPDGSVSLVTEPMENEVEITGPAAVRVWVSTSAADMDVFVALRELDKSGNEVPAVGVIGGQVPMAAGWLRASHRELDEQRSLPYRPYHLHVRQLPVPTDRPVALDIEIWPTSMILRKGHRLQLVISANDAWMGETVHDDEIDRAAERFAGVNRIHTGPGYSSTLLLPIIPKREEAT
jgi:predicted acyl esterase